MRYRFLKLWVVALVGLAAVGGRRSAVAQEWSHWRYESGNSALNVLENFLIPPPDLFWFSSGFQGSGSVGVFRTDASSPIVVDLANDPENPGASDPMVFIARRNQLYAYRPDLMGSFAAGAIQPAPGWPFDVGELIEAPPIAANITQNTTTQGVVTRRVLYVATGGSTAGTGVSIRALALDPKNPATRAPTEVWRRPVPGVLGGPTAIAGMAFADIGSDGTDGRGQVDGTFFTKRWAWNNGNTEGWQGTTFGPNSNSEINDQQDAPQDPGGRGSWRFRSTASNATRNVTTEVRFVPDQLGVASAVLSVDLTFAKRLIPEIRHLLPGSFYRWEISTNDGQSYSELFRESLAPEVDLQWQTRVASDFSFGTPQDNKSTWRLRLSATLVTGTGTDADAPNVDLYFDYPQLRFSLLGSATVQQLPVLFVTTKDGQVVAINAQPFDTPGDRGGVRTPAGSIRWTWRPAGIRPSFEVGPAVARVPLDGFDPGVTINGQSVASAIRGRNREWVVYAANDRGEVIALEAFGRTTGAGIIEGSGKVRWTQRLPAAVGSDAILTPPLVYNGATGVTDKDGRFLTRLAGYDDVVLVGTGAGRLYALDAQGDFVVGGGGPAGAQLGDPAGTTQIRWQYPDSGVSGGAFPADGVPWTGSAFNSPLAVWNGVGETNDSDNTLINLSHDDDRVYARYLKNLGQVDPTEPDSPFGFTEWIGAVRIYGGVETADPIDEGAEVHVFAADGAEVPKLLIEVEPRFLDTSADRPDENRDGIPDGSIPHGRITLLRQRWFDTQGQSHSIRMGDTIRVVYTPRGSQGTKEETLPFPCRRRQESESGTTAGAPVRASMGLNTGSLQEPAGDGRAAEELRITPTAVDAFKADPMPAMAVANNNIWVGSRYRGRFVQLDAEFLRLTGFLRATGDQPDQGNPADDQPGNADPVGSGAISQGWLYVAYSSGLLAAFSNEGGGAPGTGVAPVSAGEGPITAGRPRQNSIDKPIIRVTDANGNPMLDEERLLFDWGETIYIKVSSIGGETQEGFFGQLSRSPIRATLRGPMGDLPPVTVTPVRLASDSSAREALLEIVVPNATSSNPMTPGTKLLKETPLADRFREPHWELRVEQIGVGWKASIDGQGRTVPEGPWEPSRDLAPGDWSADSNTAPWVSLNNPIALVYNPFDTDIATPDNDANIGYVARFSTDPGFQRRFERLNGDPFKSLPINNFNSPMVLTVGVDPANGRQLLFGDHGKASPGVVFGIADRSDLGVTGGRGPLRVRVAGAKLTKLGSAAQLLGGRAGSINQNERFPDDGPDGYYPSITGDRLQVTKRGDGSNATIASVNLLGALTQRAGPDAKPVLDQATQKPIKRLQVDPFMVSVDIPRYQPDDVYATRARVPSPNTGLFTPDTAIDPRAPYLDYVGPGTAPPNLSPTQKDDSTARVSVFVDANNNGRLDLQGNYREAYRTFAVQMVVRPDFRLEVADRTVDLGRVWHGFETPPLSSLASLPPAAQSFYRSYWKPFTLVNTGNVNLPAIKPEVVLSFQQQQTGLVTLPSDGIDPFRSLTLVRDPTEPGADLLDPMNIFLRTSLDELLKPSGSPYNRGPGGWLQKSRVGSASPSTAIYPDDPSRLQPAAPMEQMLALQIPTGTPLGTYVGQVRFFNDQMVQAVPSTTSPLGYELLTVGNAGNGLLDRVGSTAAGFRTEPFTDPTFDLRVKVTENLALGSVADPNNGGASGARLASRTAPAAGIDSVNRRIALFYASNLQGLQEGRPLQFDLFGTSLRFDQAHNLYPFDPLPFDPVPWVSPLAISAPGVGAAAKNTKPGYAQDAAGNGFVFWTQQVSPQPGQTETRLLYRKVTPDTGDPQIFAPGGSASPLSPRIGPAPVVVPDSAQSPEPRAQSWYLFWHGGGTQKQNLFFSRSVEPENPTSWTTESLLPTSPSLASVSDASPSYAPDTGTLWVTYTGLSQRLGKSDAYVTKYNPRAFGDRRQFFGLLGFSPVTGDVLRPNGTRTLYMANGIDWVVDARNPAQVYLDDQPLLRLGDTGRANASGELVFDVDRASWPPLAQQGVKVVIDRAAGTVRFSMDARRMRALMGLPPPAGLPPNAIPPDPEVSADYTPGTLRLTRSEQSASGAVGFVTHSFEPSWYKGLFDAQKRPIAAQADRLWVIWRRAAGPVGLGPTLYYKALRPGIKVRRGGFRRLADIRVVSRPDLVSGTTGESRVIPLEDVDPDDGMLYFREEFEGLARVHGVPTPVEVVYSEPRTGTEVREIHFITWREESGEIPVPMDVSVNEGSVTAFPLFEQISLVDPDSGSARKFSHLQKIWLFWTSTRGTGSDIFQATIAPRFGPETSASPVAAASTSSLGRGARSGTFPAR